MPDGSGAQSAAPGSTGQVLLAEDNPINQRVATAMLRHLGFEVDIVVDGTEAVHAATQTRYRAILMDCEIPGVDGYHAASEIRRLEDPSQRTPIIAVIASSARADQKRCLAAGMDDYLEKPLRLKALAAMLALWTAELVPQSRKGGLETPNPVSHHPVPVEEGGDGVPVLDAQVLGRLERLGASTGQDLVGQLAILFLSDTDARMAELRQALADNDAEAVARGAHTLTGSSANLGATGLSRMCAMLATGRVAADGVARATAFAEIEAELVRVRAALELLAAVA